MLFLEGFKKGYHFNSDLKPVKNSKGCCGSKAVADETREDRLALVKIEQLVKNSPNGDATTLDLYSAVHSKRKRVNSMISGFINWIISLFRSKAYNTELKLLRSELDKFATLFTGKQLLESIGAKYFGTGVATNSDKKTFAQLRKEAPQLFNDSSTISEEEFKRVPFFINREGNRYKIRFAPVGENQPPESVLIDHLDQLPGLEKRESDKLLRNQAKHLYEAVRHHSTFIGDLTSDYSCEQAIGKVSLSYKEDRTSLKNNELIINYYKVEEGKVAKRADLNTIHEDELQRLIASCKEESLQSTQSIQKRLKELKSFINGLKLEIKVNLYDKVFEVRESMYSSSPITLPFNLSLLEQEAILTQKLQTQYISYNSKLISVDDFKGIHAQGLEAEKFGLNLNLELRTLEIHYADFENNQNVSQSFKVAIDFSNAMSELSELGEIKKLIQTVEKERDSKQSTLSSVLKESSNLSLNDDEKCKNAVGKVKLTHDVVTCTVNIEYYAVSRHQIVSKTVQPAPLESLKKEIAVCKQQSLDSYAGIKSKLEEIQKKLPGLYLVAYDFGKQEIILKQVKEKSCIECVNSFQFHVPTDQIVSAVEKLVVDACVSVWNETVKNPPTSSFSGYGLVKGYNLASVPAYTADSQDLANIGVSYNSETQKAVLHFYDHKETQTLEFEIGNVLCYLGGQIFGALSDMQSIRLRDRRTSVTFAEYLRREFFNNNYRLKLSELLRDMARNSTNGEELKNFVNSIPKGGYGFTLQEDANKMLKLVSTYRDSLINSEGQNRINSNDRIALYMNSCMKGIKEELKIS